MPREDADCNSAKIPKIFSDSLLFVSASMPPADVPLDFTNKCGGAGAGSLICGDRRASACASRNELSIAVAWAMVESSSTESSNIIAPTQELSDLHNKITLKYLAQPNTKVCLAILGGHVGSFVHRQYQGDSS
eukprot:m.941459 g.941459  ORF g.941459 m.941459 type:complete len:133 (+) comp23834_c0_seq2:1530-1928(+)